MAAKRWIGQAQAVAQVSTVTFAGTWLTNDTVTITINNKALTITIGETSPTPTTVALAVKEAWENDNFTDAANSKTPEDGGQDIVEHSEITATASNAVLTLTHDTPGIPFTFVSSETSAAGTVVDATPTAATGPNFWDNVDNWDTGTVPADTDDIYIDNTDISILYNIEPNLGAGAESLNSLNIGQNFTGEIGLPHRNAAGYVEYRPTYLKVEADDVIIGRGSGAGSGRIRLDTDAQPCNMRVENTGSASEDGLSAVLWKGSSASNTLIVIDGSIDVAWFGGETATVSTVEVTGGVCRLGDGVTIGTSVNNLRGDVTFFSDCATVTNSGGTMRIGGSAEVGTSLTVRGGAVLYDSSGTITSLTVGGAGAALFEFSTNIARTVTACTIGAGGLIRDDGDTVTWSAQIAPASDVRTITAG